MKNIVKISLLLVLAVNLFSCHKEKSIDLVTNNNSFMTAKITRNGKMIDFKNLDKVMIIKATSSSLELENLHIEDKSTGYKIQIVLNRQATDEFGDPIKESEAKRRSYGVLKEENGKDLTWMTSSFLGSDEDQNPKESFNITKETDTYMEGTFRFRGILTTKEVIDTHNIVEVTHGKFRAQKLNYN